MLRTTLVLVFAAADEAQVYVACGNIEEVAQVDEGR
jgi:hypothetical protein